MCVKRHLLCLYPRLNRCKAASSLLKSEAQWVLGGVFSAYIQGSVGVSSIFSAYIRGSMGVRRHLLGLYLRLSGCQDASSLLISKAQWVLGSIFSAYI